jgi:uncharacterized protein (TIGR00369 family)
MPAAETFAFEFLDRSPERARVRMPPAEAMLQVERVVHGGALSALADTAAVHLLLPELDEGQAMTSIEFKVNFLRPALDDRGVLEAEATLVKRGRSVAVVRVDVSQGGALCATGVFTYLIMDATRGRPAG